MKTKLREKMTAVIRFAAALILSTALWTGSEAFGQTTTWSGTGTNWLGNATWSAGVPNSSTNASLTGTGTLNVDTAATAASVDLANASGTLTLQILNGNRLTVSGAITDTGAGTGNIQINNTAIGNASTVLTATSLTAGSLTLAVPVSTNTTYFTFGNNVTLAVQLALGTNGNNGNASYVYTQTGGLLNLTSTSNYGLSIGQGASTANGTGTNTFNLDGGTIASQRIGVMNDDGNNSGATNRYAMTGTLNFNNGTIRNLNTTTSLFIANGRANSGFTPNTIQYDTSKPLNVVLASTGSREFQANTQSIFISPSAQLTGTGGFTKTGNGTLVFTGGGPVAVNSWSGNTTVAAGTVATDYSQIAGQAATGGTDALSNAYSATSRLILDGGNFTMTGRGSASASSANVTAHTATSFTVTLASTSGLVIGQAVSGTNVPAGTYIRRILSGTQVELSHLSSGNASLSGTTLNFGAASFANTQSINNVTLNATTSTVTVNPGAGTSTTLLSFGNVTGAGGLTKAGTGTLQLTGALDYTGATAINAGTLEFAPVSGTSVLTGNFTGSGALVKTGAGTTVLATSAVNGATTFAGSITVNEGILRIGNLTASNNSSQRFSNASSVTVGTNGHLVLQSSDAISVSNPITVNGTLSVSTAMNSSSRLGPLSLNGGNITTGNGAGTNFQSLVLNGDVTVGGTSASSINAGGTTNNGVHLASAANNVTRTFTVADVTSSAAVDLTVNAALLNGHTNATFTNTSLTKAGGGTMNLAGTNTYGGATTVNAGTLLVNGSIAGGAVAVNSGATLGGSGTINGAVSVNSGGTLAPGNSPGVLTVNNSLSVLDGSLSFELNGATVGTGYDQIALTGASAAFTLSGTSNLALSLGFTPTVNSLYFLVNNTGTSTAITGTFSQLNGVATTLTQGASFLVGGQEFLISYTGDSAGNSFTGGNDLVIQAVPEPTTWALIGLGLGVLLLARRRSQA